MPRVAGHPEFRASEVKKARFEMNFLLYPLVIATAMLIAVVCAV